MDMLNTDSAAAPDNQGEEKWRKWLGRIEQRRSYFEKGWWTLAADGVKMYEIQSKNRPDEIPFNILYANTEVLLPSLYSASPRPDVAMRNKKAQDPIAQAAEAYLTSFIDMNTPGRETFDDSVEGTTLGALVAGSGFVRLRHHPNQSCPIRTELGTYKELIWGKATRWARVPWIAFIHSMVKEEVTSQFPKVDPNKLKIETQEEADTNSRGKESECCVYELWIRDTKEVVWLSPHYEDLILESPTPDPFRLPGFFPTPGPLNLVKKPGSLDPTPIYEYYRNQAEELNRVTVRLNKVLSAIRVRGVYNNLLGDEIKKLLEDTNLENGYAPSQNAMDLQAKGFEGHIWTLPLESLITVAKELYSARVQIMGVIQQITGLSDIVRGSTVASETATAQDLKNKWGTIRLRRMQRMVQLYVRDILRLSVNMAANLLAEEQWRHITQLPFPTAQEKQKAMMMLQQQQIQQQQEAAQAQVLAQTAQAYGMQAPPAPQPQPPDPKLVAAAQAVSWGEILSTLQDDGGRSYTIDIETASTIDTDATADREEVTDFMGALAQFIAAAAPMVQLGPTGMEVIKEMLIAICSKFKFGREVKESIEKLEMPPPQQDPKAQAEMAKVQQESEQSKQEFQLKFQLEQQKAANEKEKMRMDMEKATMEHNMKMAEMQQKMQMMPLEMEMATIKRDSMKQQAAERAKPKPNGKSTSQ